MKFRSTYRKTIQNLKFKNKEIFIRTEMKKYKNNGINKIGFIKNICYK